MKSFFGDSRLQLEERVREKERDANLQRKSQTCCFSAAARQDTLTPPFLHQPLLLFRLEASEPHRTRPIPSSQKLCFLVSTDYTRQVRLPRRSVAPEATSAAWLFRFS